MRQGQNTDNMRLGTCRAWRPKSDEGELSELTAEQSDEAEHLPMGSHRLANVTVVAAQPRSLCPPYVQALLRHLRFSSRVWPSVRFSTNRYTSWAMEESVSHTLADFIDHANQLRNRLRKDGEKLTGAEVDILRAQLHDLSVIAKEVQELLLFKARDHAGEDAA